MNVEEIATVPEFSNWVYVEYALAGYGALWFLMLFFAIVSQRHIDAGAFGLIGFPVIGVIYGILRGNQRKEQIYKQRLQIERLRSMIHNTGGGARNW